MSEELKAEIRAIADMPAGHALTAIVEVIYELHKDAKIDRAEYEGPLMKVTVRVKKGKR